MKLLVLLAVALAVVGGCSSGGDDGDSGSSSVARSTGTLPEEASLEGCRDVADGDEARSCYAAALAAIMRDSDDPSTGLEEIAVEAYTEPTGRLLGDCHGLMHTVGRAYAAENGVTLENLMTYLPQTNEPGCSAGFAHGLVTAVAPEIDLGDPASSVAVCDEALTRYRR
ncbi:MAG: hypothetical protein ABWY96_03140, partial [Gaiellaceae bacterium]